jgi:hypothetical protein
LLGVQTLEQQSVFAEQNCMNREQVRQFFVRVFGGEKGPGPSQLWPAGAHTRMLFCTHGVVRAGQPQMLCEAS